MTLYFEKVWPSLPYILEGVTVTLSYTVISLILGMIWGGILALFKVSSIKSFRFFAQGYTSIFRGTPLILQLSLIYYAMPQLIGYNITPWEAGILTFSLNSGAYVSEILKAGIQTIDRGQQEAALSLGVSYFHMMKDIIFPQAIRNVLPALINEAIDLLKESALVSVIGGADILRRANIVASEKYLYFEPLLIAGVIYYILVMLLSQGAKAIEGRFSS